MPSLSDLPIELMTCIAYKRIDIAYDRICLQHKKKLKACIADVLSFSMACHTTQAALRQCSFSIPHLRLLWHRCIQLDNIARLYLQHPPIVGALDAGKSQQLFEGMCAVWLDGMYNKSLLVTVARDTYGIQLCFEKGFATHLMLQRVRYVAYWEVKKVFAILSLWQQHHWPGVVGVDEPIRRVQIRILRCMNDLLDHGERTTERTTNHKITDFFGPATGF